jgi:hypothetical protein
MRLVKTALIFCVAFSLLSACSKGNQKTINEVEAEHEQAKIAETEASSAESQVEIGESAEFDGTITASESGLSLQTGAGDFIIEGQDLSDMVGKKVKVVGALEEVEGGKKIHITAVTPME